MADKKITALTDITTLAATDVIPVGRPGNTTAYKATMAEVGSFTHEVINVKHYGALGNGTADDTAAIQAAVDAITTSHKVLYFPPGDYQISDTINIKDKQYITIRADSARLRAATGTVFTNKPMVNMCGTMYSNIYGLCIQCGLTSNYPACGLLLGRTVTLSGGDLLFVGCKFDGYFQDAVIEDICCEMVTLLGCTVISYTVAPCLFESATDLYSRTGMPDTSNIKKTFYACNFSHYYSGDGGYTIYLYKGCQELIFRDCLFYANNASTIFYFGATGAQYNIIIDSSRTEGVSPSADTRLVSVPASAGAQDLRINNLVWGVVSDAIIDISGGTLAKSYLDLRDNNNTYDVEISSGTLTTSEILVDKSGSLNVIAPGYLTYSLIKVLSTNPGTPFTGTGYYGNEGQNTNLLLAPGYAHGGFPLRMGWSTITNNDTTPSVSGLGYLVISNANATTITNFDNGIPGQEINIFFGNANTTLAHGSLLLNGADNWTAPAYSSIKLWYNSYWGYWCETGRSDPT